MKFRYEDLEVWKESVRLYRLAVPLLAKLPPEEKFGLTEQIRRALLSVILNIAEGSGRATKPDFKKFLRNAIGSVIEADAGFKLAVSLGYFSTKDYQSISTVIESVYFKLIGLEKSLKSG